ncbi:MAG: transcriptional repressor [Gammaproteobacteria bacterium]|nr:transcriptional repressor [Gammaproteobacteria bacterium]
MDKVDLQQAGLRVTGPRLKVLAVLEAHRDNHLSADDVYRILCEANDDVGVATVYRVLSQFESAGMVKRQVFSSERAVYELAEEEHHDHMICTTCGDVEEFCRAELEQMLEQLAEAHGFKPLYHDLNMYGLCRRCQAQQQA